MYPGIAPLQAPLSRYSGNPRTLQGLKSSRASGTSRQLHDSRGSGLASRKASAPLTAPPFRNSGGPQSPQGVQTSLLSEHLRQLHDSRGRGLCLAKSLSLVSSPRFHRHTGGSQGSMKQLRLAGKYSKIIISQSNTVIEKKFPGSHKQLAPSKLGRAEVIYCGAVLPAPKAPRATFVFTTIQTPVVITGSRSTYAPQKQHLDLL